MTVAQLIIELQRQDPNAKVFLYESNTEEAGSVFRVGVLNPEELPYVKHDWPAVKAPAVIIES
jgi:hypothetical protein